MESALLPHERRTKKGMEIHEKELVDQLPGTGASTRPPVIIKMICQANDDRRPRAGTVPAPVAGIRGRRGGEAHGDTMQDVGLRAEPAEPAAHRVDR